MLRNSKNKRSTRKKFFRGEFLEVDVFGYVQNEDRAAFLIWRFRWWKTSADDFERFGYLIIFHRRAWYSNRAARTRL
jgi:hypothetical protein